MSPEKTLLPESMLKTQNQPEEAPVGQKQSNLTSNKIMTTMDENTSNIQTSMSHETLKEKQNTKQCQCSCLEDPRKAIHRYENWKYCKRLKHSSIPYCVCHTPVKPES